MAEFPLEPQLSKMLITAADLRCAEEILDGRSHAVGGAAFL